MLLKECFQGYYFLSFLGRRAGRLLCWDLLPGLNNARASSPFDVSHATLILVAPL